jgi:hypothetical protein
VNTLYVYADECGTMPIDDHGDPFVGATVSALQPISGVRGLRFGRVQLLAQMTRNAATPFLAHVQPFSGYGQQMAAKFGKMDTMARARRLVRRTHEYLPRGGIAVRNMVWGHCVTQAVAQAFATYAFRAPISRLEVTFDQKTLAPENRRMVIDKCREIPQRARDSAEKFRALNERQVDDFLSNVQVAQSDVVIQWSDEPGAAGTEDGLLLADRLAWHYQKHLLRPTTPSFTELLAQAGHTGITIDVTPLLLAPIDRESIDKWKRDTGLPEPEA